MTILGCGRAPGKAILFGEHAVVYGRPALAVPVMQVWAEAVVERGAAGSGLTIEAEDTGERIVVQDAPAQQPLAAAVRLALAWLAMAAPDWRVVIRSTIPIASGLGSGAAVAAAIVRALADAANSASRSGIEASAGHSGQWEQPAKASSPDASRKRSADRPQHVLTPADLSALVYEVEKLHHGTPSGIDNTVIAYGQPVYFVRGQPPQPFAIGRPFTLVVADTGIRSPTRVAVGDVRRSWEREPARFEALFDQVAVIVEAARTAIAAGEPERLAPLMDENHTLLQEMGVSCPELDALVTAARSAGALGAKLSGGGRGGNMIALVTTETAPRVTDALQAAGAARVIVTEVRQA